MCGQEESSRGQGYSELEKRVICELPVKRGDMKVLKFWVPTPSIFFIRCTGGLFHQSLLVGHVLEFLYWIRVTLICTLYLPGSQGGFYVEQVKGVHSRS